MLTIEEKIMKGIVVLLGMAVLVEGQVAVHGDGSNPAELNATALQAYYQARYQEAETLYREALTGWDRQGPQSARDRAITAGNLAALLRTEGRYRESEALLLDCLRQAEAEAAPNAMETGRAASGLAALYLVWGQFPKAESMATRAQTIFDQLDSARIERVNNWSVLASVYIAQARYPEAQTLLHKVLEGSDDALVLRSYNELALVAQRQNHLPEAESLALRALEMARRTLPPGHPTRAAILNNLAQICRFQGRYQEAEKYYREAIAIWVDSLGPQHPDAAKGYMNLAAFYHERGREPGAEDLYRRAAGIFESAYGANHPLFLVARNELAEVLRAEGRFSESEKLGRSTLASLEEELGTQDSRVIRALENRAKLFDSTRHPKQAAALRDRAHQMSLGFRNGE
jgi:tetratricopeptide (TPR) repeat protein